MEACKSSTQLLVNLQDFIVRHTGELLLRSKAEVIQDFRVNSCSLCGVVEQHRKRQLEVPVGAIAFIIHSITYRCHCSISADIFL